MTDIRAIKNNLEKIYRIKKEKSENLRMKVKSEVTDLLVNFFSDQQVSEVWIFGSVIKPYCFTENSDIDIAVAGFKGSRLDLYTDLLNLLNRPLDLFMLDRSSFADEIKMQGERIV